MQSKLMSWAESVTNVVVGFVINLGGQAVIFPVLGIHVDVSTNIRIGMFFITISLIRSYIVRRLFARRTMILFFQDPIRNTEKHFVVSCV